MKQYFTYLLTLTLIFMLSLIVIIGIKRNIPKNELALNEQDISTAYIVDPETNEQRSYEEYYEEEVEPHLVKLDDEEQETYEVDVYDSYAEIAALATYSVDISKLTDSNLEGRSDVWVKTSVTEPELRALKYFMDECLHADRVESTDWKRKINCTNYDVYISLLKIDGTLWHLVTYENNSCLVPYK